MMASTEVMKLSCGLRKSELRKDKLEKRRPFVHLLLPFLLSLHF